VTITVAIHKIKNNTLNIIVTLNRVFSMPRLAVKTPPVSAPVRPPNPAPLLCKMMLIISAIDVIIKAINKYTSTPASEYTFILMILAGGLYLPLGE
jgi:hypothetical protein